MAAAGGGFHPDFSSDGDIVLQSKEGINFRLDSAILKAGSTAFRDMLNFPRDPKEPSNAPVVLTEDTATIAFLFNCVFPTPSTADLRDYDEIFNVAEAALKYDIPCVFKNLRFVVLTEEKFRDNYLNLYALASYCGWRDVVRSSSNKSLEEDIFSSKNLKILERAKSVDLIALLNLHMRRKEILKETVRRCERYALDTPDQYGPEYYVCKRCDCPIVGEISENSESVRAVEIFRSRFGDYIDRCPLAPDLMERKFWEKTVGGVAVLKCQGCGSEVFDIHSAIHSIGFLQNQGNGRLPREVEDAV